MSYRWILLLLILSLPADAAKRCAGDSDCSSGYECKEATDGKSYCYRDEGDAPPKKPPGKKKKWVCDANLCGGRYVCFPFPVVWCDKCCWVTE